MSIGELVKSPCMARNRTDRLPLPSDVEDALVAYLRQSRRAQALTTRSSTRPGSPFRFLNASSTATSWVWYCHNSAGSFPVRLVRSRWRPSRR